MIQAEREYVLSINGVSTDPNRVGKRGTLRLKAEKLVTPEDLGLSSPWEVDTTQKVSHYEAGIDKRSNLTIGVVGLKRPLTEEEKRIESSPQVDHSSNT